MEFEELILYCDKHNLNVSRETFHALNQYVELLNKWNNTVNLVSKSTVSNIWKRHIVDSIQLLKYIDNKNAVITDFGSGAGLPGVILSICGIKRLNLVESDVRKSVFLSEAAKLSNNEIIIHNERIEKLEAWYNDIIVARALAPLKKLLDLSSHFINYNKKWLFLKGKTVVQEIKEAQKFYNIEYQLYPSVTSEDAYILQVNSYKQR